MIYEYLFEKTLDSLIGYSKKLFADTKGKFLSSKEDIQSAIAYHLSSISNWSEEVSFKDLRKAKLTRKIFVELDIYLYPRRIRIDPDETISTLPLQDIFREKHQHFILQGQPGAGKTTSMKYLCYRLIHDEEFYPNLFGFPVVVKLRDLNAELSKKTKKDDALASIDSIIFSCIFRFLSLSVQLDDNLFNSDKSEDRLWLAERIERIVVRLLEDLKVLLIIEGFDELVSPEHRNIALGEIRKLANQLKDSTLIVTSRTGEFPYSVEGANHFEICPLNKAQVIQFSNKWLEDEEKSNKFLREISKSPFADTMIRPLTLAHLCAIYERTDKIPDRPKTVYRKIVWLLLEEWDEQRSVRRMSKYANFEIDRKFEFLCNLSYELTTELNRSIFSSGDLFRVYKRIHGDFDLQINEAETVIDEIESHTGLFVQAGYGIFEFAHKSIQEYLTAEYIVKLPRVPTQTDVLIQLPNELAIAVTISSSPSSYFAELVLNAFLKAPLPQHFYEAFVNRLIQEKPEFNAQEYVDLSLAILYSLYLDESILRRPTQMRLFYEDNLVEQLERFVQLLSIRNPGKVILKFYRRREKIQAISDIEIYRLEKFKDLDSFSLPQVLFARPSFFDKEKRPLE